MSNQQLPPLPEERDMGCNRNDDATVMGFTADQLHAYGLATWRAAMEHAAQIARLHDAANHGNAGKLIAAAIRSAEPVTDGVAAVPAKSERQLCPITYCHRSIQERDEKGCQHCRPNGVSGMDGGKKE